jgi:hypothetical protein
MVAPFFLKWKLGNTLPSMIARLENCKAPLFSITMKNKYIFCLALMAFCLVSCQKNSVDDWKTIKKLYRTYKNGTISECTLNGEKYFVAGLNAFDAGASIYNKDGIKVGDCNYAWGLVDSLCGKLEECEVVYREEHHISGQAAVDKYNLNQRIFR